MNGNIEAARKELTELRLAVEYFENALDPYWPTESVCKTTAYKLRRIARRLEKIGNSKPPTKGK